MRQEAWHGRRVVLALLTAASGGTARAQSPARWRPARPIRLIVGFPPGGFTDILARSLAPLLQAQLEQAVVVENRGGAAGIIGADLVAHAAPDGTTLLLGHSTANAIAANLDQRLGFDPRTAFTPITLVAAQPHALLVNAGAPYASTQDLLDAARRAPGRLTYASSGVASVQHVAGEMLRAATGIDVVHVPYRGTGPSLADLAGGQVDFVIDGLAAAAPLMHAGRIKALAVSTSGRVARFPDLPTLDESGAPGVEIRSWFGLFGPAGLPAPAVESLYAATVEALASQPMRRLLDDASAEAGGMPPSEFAAFIAREIARYRDVAARMRIAVE
ncbi:Bug family tripartite tricarboxylate transporter substrate binding protein [Roseomonas populi]|uniref:Tripartite tricarboxylate transporter substrate binding protein n=1 Tax=Roseomonas populi TaxID=3121582 RepID=A0ABT1X6R8_9PROT|nr:tripartite tricarboxylate transporter substrate binding protein [Roseomonas pecuniae]MCR0983802.1 tripartite tricarboxylate transporter substrate binding protein [Roseomonas pecuniae]